MSPDFDGNFYDWIPVWSEKESDLLNVLLDSHELPDCAFRHLRSNNHEYCWIGEDKPRPMDLSELARAIAMKYETELTPLTNKDHKTDVQVDKDIWQGILKNLPQGKAKVGGVSDSFPKTWDLILDDIII